MTNPFYVFRLLCLSVLLALMGLLNACRSTPKPDECDQHKAAYLKAQNHAPLKAPDGLEAPDQHNALTIPPDNGQTIDTKKCLQRAPTYFGTAGRIAASPEEMVADWAQAWADRNSNAVMAMYAGTFATDSPAGAAAWLAQRRAEVDKGPLPNGRITNLRITQQGVDQRLARFTQQFGDNAVQKELVLVRDSGLWKIAVERVITAESTPSEK